MNSTRNRLLLAFICFLSFFVLAVFFRARPAVAPMIVDQDLAVLEDEESLAGAYVVVHLEVANPLSIRETWTSLQETIALADDYQIPLTLLITPQWADFFLGNAEALASLREWEANGHELGAHHHSTEHLYWDGFTNDDTYVNDPDYRGDMDDFMALLNQLPADGVMESGGIMDAELDWPLALSVQSTNSGGGSSASGTGPQKDEMVGPMQRLEYLGQGVIVFSKSGYAIDHLPNPVDLEDVQEALASAGVDDYLGVVINDNSIDEHFDEVQDLFELFRANEVQVSRLIDLASPFL
jgi:hypothetical protein